MNNQKNISKKLRIVESQQALVEPEIGAFPLEFFKQIFSPTTYQLIDWHWHTGVQFCYVTKGSIRFQVVKEPIHLVEGDGIFINARQAHTASPEGSYGEYLCLNLSPYLLGFEGSDLFQRYMAPILYQAPTPFLAIRRSDNRTSSALNLLERCGQEADTASGIYGLKLLSDLILLWDQMQKLLPESESKKDLIKNNSRMQQILLYFQENYTRKITLQEIAEHVHLSRSECSRFFHSITGQPLFQYLTELRVNRSIELLAHTDRTVTEIAYDVGFGSQSYFNQRFRAVKGLTPEQFRKSLDTGNTSAE